MPDLPTLEQKLFEARLEVRHFQVMAMRPNLSPEQRALIWELERSARAEVKLRLKAIERAKSKSER
jgi:hypothetical protein